jgi:DNA-binding NarL/FixJ family response regulator
MTPIKVLIADDHELIRKGFATLLKKHTEIRIVGDASNGAELLQKTEALAPDVVITDIQMPGIDGIEATRQIRKKHPHINIIALSTFNDDHLIIDMLEAGAQGYLLKNTTAKELSDAVHAVFHGGNYFCEATNRKLAHLIGMSMYKPNRARPKPEFTDKEVDVMRMMCDQLQNTDIAEKMNMSVRTVEGYRKRIFEKTDTQNLAGVVVFAIRNGFYKI